MSNDRKEIGDKIRDGSYFTDAINWYNGKYLYPITERSMMFLFAIAALFALIPIAGILNKTAGDIPKLPFPIYTSDSTEHFSVIKPLAKEEESAQTAIAKYLIEDYIKSREEYIYKDINADKLKKLLKKIKSSSAKNVLNEYVSYMSDTNPYSPLTRYKYHTNRLIEIKSLSFLDSDQTSGKAKVIFEANEISNDSNNKQSSMWEVILNFRLPDIATIAKNGAPLRFIVSYYRAKPLDNAAKKDIIPVSDTPKDIESEKKAVEAPQTPNQGNKGQ